MTDAERARAPAASSSHERSTPPALTPFHRLMASGPVGAGVLGIAVLAMLAFGLAGVGRGGGPLNGDMRFLYAAGRAWLAGRNPYVLDDIVATTPDWLGLDFARLHFTFAYPPQASWLSMALAACSLSVASALMVGLNLAAVAVLAWSCTRLAAAPATTAQGADDRAQRLRVLRFMAPVLVCGSPFTQHVLFMGQTSLLAVAALSAGWYLAVERGSVWAAGALLGATSIKPQLSVLPLLLLILERRPWKLLLVAAGAAVLLALPAWIINGPVTSMRTWMGAVDLYRQGDVQVAGFQHVFGVQSLFASGGVALPNLFVLGLGVVAWVRLRARALTPGERLGLGLAASVLFFYSHDYDLVALSPLLAALWLETAGSTGQAALLLAAVGLLFVPQRALRVATSGPLLHWREGVVLALLVWRLVAARRRGVESPPAGAPVTGSG